MIILGYKMKFLLLPFLLSSFLFALFNDIKTLKANFTQTITDEKNTTIIYKGILIAKKPNSIVWHYKTPIEKSIYINSKRVLIVEPEIEQVISKKLENEINFFDLFYQAKKIDDTHYETHYQSEDFILVVKKNKLVSILFNDHFNNEVDISFDMLKENISIPISTFKVKIPEGFDYLSE
jgi:outer membrane lipoprotein carrier protein